MNRKEYERWETPVPKRFNNKKWIVIGVLVLFAFYFIGNLKISPNHDLDKDEIEIVDVVPLDDY